MSDDSGYGVLGQERLRVLLLRTAHLSHEQRLAVAQWANRVIVDHGILENVLAGFVEIVELRQEAVDRVAVRLTDAGRVALREADELRNVGGEG